MPADPTQIDPIKNRCWATLQTLHTPKQTPHHVSRSHPDRPNQNSTLSNPAGTTHTSKPHLMAADPTKIDPIKHRLWKIMQNRPWPAMQNRLWATMQTLHRPKQTPFHASRPHQDRSYQALILSNHAELFLSSHAKFTLSNHADTTHI